MAFLRKQTSEGSIAELYSVIQKCIRRGLEKECLYYSEILFNEGTPNSLRKRLVYVTNEDIGHIKLSNEIVECKDEDLFKYIVVCCRMKKTHDSAWLSRLALHYSMNNIKTDDEELIEAMKLTEYVRNDDYKSIREYIGKEYSKLYTFSGKNNLVWASYILFNQRPELNQEYSLDIDIPEKRKFDNLPFWVYDKHVSGGTKGYQFFFDNSLVVNENIYGENGDKFADECKKVYLDDMFHNITLGFNFLCVGLFLITYGIELRRENWCVKNLDINHDYPDNHLDYIISTKPKLKKELYKHNNRYFKITTITSSVYMVNLILSSIIIYTNYVGIQAVTSYISYVVLILLKIYNSLFISYTSLKKEKALSGYITEFSSFNVFDEDVNIVQIDTSQEIIRENDIDLNINNP